MKNEILSNLSHPKAHVFLQEFPNITHRRDRKINRINAILGIILFIDNDDHMTYCETNFSTARFFINCCKKSRQSTSEKAQK